MADAASTSPAPPASRVLASRFELVSELGRGGFGTVYRARDRVNGGEVALKVLSSDRAEAILGFKQEFRALADLRHPSLATLYELFADDETWFFTMELVDGRPFGATLVDLPPGEERWEILRRDLGGVARGVSALHAAGFLHRDIKPSNVLVEASGRVVLVDFGLVREAVVDVDPETSVIVGSPGYLAPEQASGRAEAASDWYGVGVMLFRALTGRLPFEGRGLEQVRAKLLREAPRARELAPESPDDLDALCATLLARAPADREGALEHLARLAAGPGAERESRSALPPAGSRFPPAAPLTGRRPELDALLDATGAADATDATEQSFVLVRLHGSSGMGKSTLLRRFRRELAHVRAGAVVLAAQCYEHESLPFKALDGVIDELTRYVSALPASEAASLLPSELPALARLFPVMRPFAAGPRPSFDVAQLGPADVRRRAVGALREILTRLAMRRRLVLIVDDAQWGDADSAAILGELFAGPDPPRVVLVVSYRTEDTPHSPFLRAIAELGDHAGARARGATLQLAPLAFDDALAIARAVLARADVVDGGLAERIAREAEGVPLFVSELAWSLARAPGPAREAPLPSEAHGALDAALAARVRELPDSARRMLQLVAIASRPVPRSLLRRACALDDGGDAALAALRVTRLVRSRASAGGVAVLEPFHARVRDFVVRTLDADVASLHRALAFALEASEAADVEQLAFHFGAAGDVVRQMRYLARAAEHAAATMAFEHAARLYRTALDLGATRGEPETPLRLGLASALLCAGRPIDAARAYLAAAAAPETDAADAHAHRRLAAELLLRGGELEEGLARLATELRAFGLTLPRSPLVSVAKALYFRARTEGKLAVAPSDARTAPREAELADMCWSAAMGLTFLDTVRASYFHARAHVHALRSGSPRRLARSLAVAGATRAAAGGAGLAEGEALITRAERMNESVGDADVFVVTALSRMLVSISAARWADALVHGDVAEQRMRDARGVRFMAEVSTVHRHLLLALWFEGRAHEMALRAPGYLREAEQRGNGYGAARIRAGYTNVVWLVDDDAARAREEADAGIAILPRDGFHDHHLHHLCARAETSLYVGDAPAALATIRACWARARSSFLAHVQRFRILMRHVRARAALAAIARGSTPGGALLRLAEADIAGLEREGTAWGGVFALLVRAATSHLAGDDRGAAALLGLAERLALREGMSLYALAARRQRGVLEGGPEGDALAQAAELSLIDRGVRAPARLAEMLAPGFAGRGDVGMGGTERARGRATRYDLAP